MDRRTAISALGAGLITAALPAFAQTRQLGERPAHLIVAYPAGGVADFAGRTLADGLRTVAGWPAPLVENKTGAGGNIALDYLVRQSRNESSFALFSNSLVTTNPFVPPLASKNVDPLKELVPVAAMAEMVLMLAVASHLQVNTLDEFLKEARSRSTEKRLRIGIAGLGSPHHLSALLLEREAKLELTLAPYKGGAPMIADAAGGHIDAVFTTIPVGGPMVEAGKLKWIAVVQDTQVPAIPGIPSLAKLFGGVTIPSWLGLFAKLDTPKAVVHEMHSAVNQVVNSAQIASKLRDNGLEPLNLSYEDTVVLVKKEAEFMGKLLRELKFDFAT